MLARSVRWTYFLCESGCAKYLKERETRKFHVFFVLVWKQEQVNQSNNKLNFKKMKKNLMSKRTKGFLTWLVLLLAVTLGIASCNKNGLGPNENGSGNGDNPEPETPVAPIPDPEGTVTVNFNSGHSGNYHYIEIGTIHIDEANNFECYNDDVQFANVGEVNGLGAVISIPAGGWGYSVAVIPGNGYVARHYYNPDWTSYVRLYVVNYIIGTNGGIIGATVKYQYPFQPEME